jgi:hypothetical protein
MLNLRDDLHPMLNLREGLHPMLNLREGLGPMLNLREGLGPMKILANFEPEQYLLKGHQCQELMEQQKPLF